MSNKYKVAIIIPTFNSAKYVREALDSLIAQTMTDWEAIVIDNFSTDSTVEIVASYTDDRIKLMSFANHGVIAASRNYGIINSKSKYIAFLDSDDLWYAAKLEKCINFLESEKIFGMVCHGLKWFGNDQNRNKFYGKSDNAEFIRLLRNGNCIATSSVVVNREHLEKVGLFSENEKIATAEDYHLWLKIAKSGVKIGIINEILGGLRFHGGNTGTVERKYSAIKCVVNEFMCQDGPNKLTKKLNLIFRYGLIEYEAARNSQINKNYKEALIYLLKAIKYKPIYLRIYAALIINSYLFLHQKFK